MPSHPTMNFRQWSTPPATNASALFTEPPLHRDLHPQLQQRRRIRQANRELHATLHHPSTSMGRHRKHSLRRSTPNITRSRRTRSHQPKKRRRQKLTQPSAHLSSTRLLCPRSHHHPARTTTVAKHRREFLTISYQHNPPAPSTP